MTKEILRIARAWLLGFGAAMLLLVLITEANADEITRETAEFWATMQYLKPTISAPVTTPEVDWAAKSWEAENVRNWHKEPVSTED
jgi:hypothetical protein